MEERNGIDLLVIGAICLVVLVILAAPSIDWAPIIVGGAVVMFILMRIFLPMPWQSGIRLRKEDKEWNTWIGPGRKEGSRPKDDPEGKDEPNS